MKKGFTLIELLAVIVILAIIALIATPIILNIINDAKKSSNDRSVEMYKKTLENAVADFQLKEGRLPSSIEELKKGGYVVYDGNEVNCDIEEIDKNGTVNIKNCKVGPKQPLTLAKKILSVNPANADNVKSEYVSSEAGININDLTQFGACYINDQLYSMTFNAYDKESCERIYNYCGMYVNTTQSNCSLMGQGDLIEGTGVWKIIYNGLGLYSNTNTTNGSPTYYFRGTVDNNYVSFAQKLWRIVRINEDGTIRLILNEYAGESKFNESSDDQKYAGYMYGDENNANATSSTIKAFLDDWYSLNLLDYETLIADSGFCGDRTKSDSEHFGTATGFACPEESRDLYTTSNSTKGNKALTYPIGLLTVNEYLYGGDYLYSPDGWDDYYYFITPEGFYDHSYMRLPSQAATYFSTTGVEFNTTGINVTNSLKVRPVVNIKANVLYKSGTGTENDPYVIE